MAAPAGFEPATSDLGGPHSILLSYGAWIDNEAYPATAHALCFFSRVPWTVMLHGRGASQAKFSRNRGPLRGLVDLC